MTMPNLAGSLIAASAAVILLLGLIHLLYTFRGHKLYPRDAELEARLRDVSPVITRQTTMWKAWVGFTSAPLRQPLLGYAGFLQFFDATFFGQREEVELAVNSAYSGT